MAQTKDALLKSYNTRLKEDVKSMLENFEGKILIFFLLIRYSSFFSLIFRSDQNG
jgi:hypothetical protein